MWQLLPSNTNWNTIELSWVANCDVIVAILSLVNRSKIFFVKIHSVRYRISNSSSLCHAAAYKFKVTNKSGGSFEARNMFIKLFSMWPFPLPLPSSVNIKSFNLHFHCDQIITLHPHIQSMPQNLLKCIIFGCMLSGFRGTTWIKTSMCRITMVCL